MHARQVRANPSGVRAEPLKADTDNLFPQEGQAFSEIMKVPWPQNRCAGTDDVADAAGHSLDETESVENLSWFSVPTRPPERSVAMDVPNRTIGASLQ
jgi:hypothetical protein